MVPAQQVLNQVQKLVASGEHPRAIELLDKVVASKNDDAYLLYFLGTLYCTIGFNGTAISLLKNSLLIDPKNAEAWLNIGACYRREERKREAQTSYEAGLSFAKKNTEIHQDLLTNLIGCYINQGNPQEGEKYGRMAVSMYPDNHMAAKHLAFVLLEQGKYKEGWGFYERRIETQEFHKRDYKGAPKWGGDKISGTLVIHGEQGLGDEIMFMSCWDNVKDKADKIVIECAERLIPMFERSFGVKCYKDNESLMVENTPDAWIAMGSLPHLFRNKKEDFSGAPFLKFDEEKKQKYRDKFVKDGLPVIGIAWKGGTKGSHEVLRSVPLEMWGDILKEECKFVSLQYNDVEDHVKKDEKIVIAAASSDKKKGGREVSLISHDNDIEELNAAAAACDLVITVDQTLVHQCGAMGIECWVMCPSKPSFRYELAGDMPWYKSVRLYRQVGDSWSKVISDIARDLRCRLS